MREPYSDATLGDMLRERRTTLAMTMREVAGTALSPTAVNNIEKGKIKPTIETVMYLCKVLRLKPEKLLLFHHDLSKAVPELLKIVDSFLKLDLIEKSITLLYDMYWVASEHPDTDELIAEIQFKLAQVFARTGRYDSAQKVINEAYRHYLIHKNVPKQLDALCNSGCYSIAERQLDVAVMTFRQAIELAQRYHISTSLVGDIFMNLAKALYLRSDLKEALYFSKQSEFHFRVLGDLDGVAKNALQQAVILTALDHAAEAEELARHAYEHCLKHNNGEQLAESALILADILCVRHAYADAQAYYEQAVELKKQHRPDEVFKVEIGLSKLMLSQQRTSEAIQYAESALQRVRCPEPQSYIYKLLAQCHLQTQNLKEYREQMNLAFEALQNTGRDIAAALLLCELADETGDMSLMRTATRTLRQLYDRRDALHTH